MSGLSAEEREMLALCECGHDLSNLHSDFKGCWSCGCVRGNGAITACPRAIDRLIEARVKAALEAAAVLIERDMNHAAVRNATLATAARIVRAAADTT